LISTVQYFERLGSTNDVGKRLLQTMKPAHGALVVADAQDRGHGRMDRRWETPSGLALAFTLVLEPSWPVNEAHLLSVAASMAVVDALRAMDPSLALSIKWPNDIFLGPQKLAGILVENRILGDKVVGSIIGFGCNVNQNRSDFPESLQPIATSLRLTTGKEWDRMEVLTAILNTFHKRYLTLPKEGDALMSHLTELLVHHPGESLLVDLGYKVVQGAFREIARDGSLVLDSPGGQMTLSWGEILHLRGEK